MAFDHALFLLLLMQFRLWDSRRGAIVPKKTSPPICVVYWHLVWFVPSVDEPAMLIRFFWVCMNPPVAVFAHVDKV
jgi:hypothetical protein